MCVPKHYYSGSNAELITELPVPQASTYAHRRIVMQLFLPDLKVGEVIDVNSEFQATNNLRYNVMLVSFLLLTPNKDSVREGIEVTEANGRNVSHNTHHDFHVKSQALEITPTTAGDQYLNVVAYSASSAAPADGSARLKIDQDYGRLGILRFSPCPVEALEQAVRGLECRVTSLENDSLQ